MYNPWVSVHQKPTGKLDPLPSVPSVPSVPSQQHHSQPSNQPNPQPPNQPNPQPSNQPNPQPPNQPNPQPPNQEQLQDPFDLNFPGDPLNSDLPDNPLLSDLDDILSGLEPHLHLQQPQPQSQPRPQFCDVPYSSSKLDYLLAATYDDPKQQAFLTEIIGDIESVKAKSLAATPSDLNAGQAIPCWIYLCPSVSLCNEYARMPPGSRTVLHIETNVTRYYLNRRGIPWWLQPSTCANTVVIVNNFNEGNCKTVLQFVDRATYTSENVLSFPCVVVANNDPVPFFFCTAQLPHEFNCTIKLSPNPLIFQAFLANARSSILTDHTDQNDEHTKRVRVLFGCCEHTCLARAVIGV